VVSIPSDSATSVFVLTNNGHVWASSNNGASFLDVTPGTACNSMAAGSGKVVMCGTNSGALRSSDGGGSWVSAGIGLPNAFGVMVIDPSQPLNVFLGSYTAGIFRTTTGGL
ncbi:MAG: hypothetical protein JST92_00770, partial [Deltaproteobacteria bacterium]|nr:hypothetical protein [Deltaproteobacteria bacterium]